MEGCVNFEGKGISGLYTAASTQYAKPDHSTKN